ncbi:MAG: hypothetical protein methR_P2093 [Methyloprofundus sp.]|nr:MAG: hypothetical protein methR_P2093 [Methyloprofundus sp.]
MEEKKYQIFISSTYTDLIAERNKIIETLLGIYHLPVGMEMFSAGNDEQWEIIKDTIATSDYYILIIGHRYGSVTTDGISYTEKEYNYALELGKPILSFVKNRETATKPEERETDSKKIKKLNQFVTKATSNKMCDFWENKDELAMKVAITLPKSFSRNPQIGWVRGDQALSPKISEELAELSKKNRELTEELILLREKVSNRFPKFNITINGENDCYEYLIDQSSNNYIKINDKLTYDEIPSDLSEYITKDEVDSYIKSLPNKNTIQEFEERIYFYN